MKKLAVVFAAIVMTLVFCSCDSEEVKQAKAAYEDGGVFMYSALIKYTDGSSEREIATGTIDYEKDRYSVQLGGNVVQPEYTYQRVDNRREGVLDDSRIIPGMDRELLGFFAIETPAKGGPVGVLPSARRMGISRALGLVGIKAMRDKGYKYAVSGRVHPWFVSVEESLVGLIAHPGKRGILYGHAIGL